MHRNERVSAEENTAVDHDVGFWSQEKMHLHCAVLPHKFFFDVHNILCRLGDPPTPQGSAPRLRGMEMNTVARTRLDKWLVISKLVVSNDELVVTVLTTWNLKSSCDFVIQKLHADLKDLFLFHKCDVRSSTPSRSR